MELSYIEVRNLMDILEAIDARDDRNLFLTPSQRFMISNMLDKIYSTLFDDDGV